MTDKVPDKSIFGYDPLIGCPFDDSEMRMVEEWCAFKIGLQVEFRGPNKLGTMERTVLQGEIVGIGENAKYFDGTPFTALAVKVGHVTYCMTEREVKRAI